MIEVALIPRHHNYHTTMGGYPNGHKIPTKSGRIRMGSRSGTARQKSGQDGGVRIKFENSGTVRGESRKWVKSLKMT